MKQNLSNAQRRAFLRTSASLVASGVVTPAAISLLAMSQASAATATDYKALVVVNLNGGNDSYNTVIPYDGPSNKLYTSYRPTLAYSTQELTASRMGSVGLASGLEFALSPDLPLLYALFKKGHLGVVKNVGGLVQPLTKAQFVAGQGPRRLGSHNDQKSVWQAFDTEGAKVGWLGRMLDLFEASNNTSLFSSISVEADSLAMSGDRVTPYHMSAKGLIKLGAVGGVDLGLSADLFATLRADMVDPGNHLIAQAYADVYRRSEVAYEQLAQLYGKTANFKVDSTFAVIAKMISISQQLGVKRQAFTVNINGFDTHSNQIARHNKLLDQVDRNIGGLYAALESLGMQDKVTIVTASEFGRGLNSNDDGTDHGWGSDHFVVGGAVKGGRFWGKAPVLGDNGPDDTGRGRLIPTTAFEQLFAGLGSWYGLSATELNDIFPRLGNFDKPLAMFS
jgi:uncharacterized protein (DUF1501 family)